MFGVLGSSGCGKNSFLASVFGEMIRLSGKIHVNGSIAYAPRKPWIQNTTLEANILFGRVYNDYKYNQTLQVCGLTKEEINVALVRNEKSFMRLDGGEDQEDENRLDDEVEVS